MAQIRDFAGNVGKRDYYMVDPKSITVDPSYNIRDYDAAENIGPDEVLYNSIRENGIKVPLVCRYTRDDKMVLVQGHRRLRQVMRLIKEGHEIASVPVVPEAKTASDEDRVLDLFLSNSGQPLTALEKAEGLKKLIAFGWPDDKIADKLGYTMQMVADLKVLISASGEVKGMVKTGEVAPSTAVEATRRVGADKAAETIKKVGAAKKAKAAKEAATTGKKQSGKAAKDSERVSVRDIKRATGDEGALSRKDIKKLVTALRWIAEHDGEGKCAARANKALGDAGLLGLDL